MRVQSVFRLFFSFLLITTATSLEAQQLSKTLKKAAQDESKALTKQGWKVKPGALPLSEQMMQSYLAQTETNEEGEPKWIIGTASSKGTVYNSARASALIFAKNELAKLIEAELPNTITAKLLDEEKGETGSVSVAKVTESIKGKMAGRIGKVRMLSECHLMHPDGTVEVLIRVATSRNEAIQSAIRVFKDSETYLDGDKNSKQVPITVTGNTQRMAFVIGNSDYATGTLPNPKKDARALKDKLSSLGFTTSARINLSTRQQMEDAISQFCQEAKGCEVAVFYYAGHAQQDNGVNYLFPVAERIVNGIIDPTRCVSLNWVLKSMESAGIREKIILLDACRDYPGASDKGLSRLEVPKGFCISYAAQAGQPAIDDIGQGHSPYIIALLEQLSTNNKLNDMFDNVRLKVESITPNQQTPMYFNNLNNPSFYFNPPKSK